MGYKCSDPSCGKSLFKRGDKFVEDGRNAPAAGAPAYTGEKRRAGELTPPPPPAPPPTQKPPRRDHFLTRTMFGGKPKDDAGAKP